MAGLEVRDFSAPDETRAPDKTKIEIVRMGGASAARMSLEPGWRWSECIKPVAGTDSCQAHHVGVIMSGTLHVAHDDGGEQDIGPGQRVRDRAGARRVGRRRRDRRRLRVRRPDGGGVREGLVGLAPAQPRGRGQEGHVPGAYSPPCVPGVSG